MNKKSFLNYLIIALLSIITIQCESLTEPNNIIIGALCNDGTISTATGPEACVNNGGVKKWIYR